MSFSEDNDFKTKFCMWRKQGGELCQYQGYCKYKILKGCSL